jgi:hypothetical protein
MLGLALDCLIARHAQPSKLLCKLATDDVDVAGTIRAHDYTYRIDRYLLGWPQCTWEKLLQLLGGLQLR